MRFIVQAYVIVGLVCQEVLAYFTDPEAHMVYIHRDEFYPCRRKNMSVRLARITGVYGYRDEIVARRDRILANSGIE